MAEQGNGLSRRSFLKASAGTAALGSLGLLSACAPQSKEQPANSNESDESAPVSNEEVSRGFCVGYCNNGCYLNLHIRDGILVRTSPRDLPDTDYNRICPKGYTHPYRMYSSERVQHPLKRVGERGSGEWEQISWDDAISEIATAWKDITDEYGVEAMAIHGLSGSFGCLSGSYSYAPRTRFTIITGATSLYSPVDEAVAFAAKRMMGTSYFFTTNEPKDILNAKTIFVWGANPAGSQMQTFHFITEARDKGANVIVIDPMFNANAALANKYVPIKSATDGALALGMMRVILDNGWQDTEFITQHTCAPFLVNPETHKFLRLSDLGQAEAGSDKDFVVVADASGELVPADDAQDPQIEGTKDVEGITYTTSYTLMKNAVAEWDVDRASSVTGIPADEIIELARTYAQDTPTYTYCFFGADHYYNGHWNGGDIFALALITGNVGRSGSGAGVSGTTDNSLFLNIDAVIDAPCPTENPRTIISTRFAEVMDEQTYNGEPFELHGLFVTGGNLVGNHSDRLKNIEALKKLDLFVVADMMMSETAEWADYVLPASYWFEHEEMMTSWLGHPHILHSPQSLQPLGESKSDMEIYRLLAEALGYGDQLAFSSEDWCKMILDTDECRSMDITYEKLAEEGALRAVPTKETYIFAEGGEFPTPTKRASFYIEDPTPSNDYEPDFDFSKERLPYWEGPMEIAGGFAVNEKYPLQLIGEHPRLRTHTQWYDVEALREISPEQYIYINPDDAKAAGIQTGDEVRVHNDRGELVGHAVLRPNNPPGILSAVKGWTNKQTIKGHLSDTTPLQMNPFCANQAFNDNAVAIEKA